MFFLYQMHKLLTKPYVLNCIVLYNIFSWLHQDRFFAVAQKKYVHIYDDTGSEVHVLKDHRNVHRVHFLPYHFLLTTVVSDFIIHIQNSNLLFTRTNFLVPSAKKL